MSRNLFVVLTAATAAVLVLSAVAAARDVELEEHLKPFEFLLGQTWKGTFSNSTPENPMVDVARWEAILDGKVLRGSHSLNQGQYAGETMLIWDANKNSLVYFYFTNAGFYTQGTMKLEKGAIVGHEYVTGHESITEVRSEMVPRKAGGFLVVSSYLTNGEWVTGHEAVYEAVEDE